MFDVLMGSRLRPRFRPGQGFLVAVLHGAMVAGVVQGVTVPAPSPPSPRVDTTVFMVEPPALPPSAPVFGEEAMVSTTPFEALPVPIDVPADTEDPLALVLAKVLDVGVRELAHGHLSSSSSP